MHSSDRRLILAMLGGAAAAPFLATAAFAGESFTMWRDPGCGCCLAWAKKVEAAFERQLTVIGTSDMAGIKRARGVPGSLQSCHTALIHGYTIEGHVPPADIKRLIALRREGVSGLAVPGMPIGSPGMEHGAIAKPIRSSPSVCVDIRSLRSTIEAFDCGTQPKLATFCSSGFPCRDRP